MDDRTFELLMEKAAMTTARDKALDGLRESLLALNQAPNCKVPASRKHRDSYAIAAYVTRLIKELETIP